MPLCDRLNVRPRSREFIEARVLRLLMDTCSHHAEARVHPVAASPSARPGSPEADLESPRSPPNRRPIKPPLLRFLLLVCLIKARVPRVSSGLPVQPPSVQPPEAEWIQIYSASTKPHFGPGFGYVPALGLLRGVVCLSRSHSHREPPHSPGPPSGLTRCQTVPLFWGI